MLQKSQNQAIKFERLDDIFKGDTKLKKRINRDSHFKKVMTEYFLSKN